jgi:hypothetical protein
MSPYDREFDRYVEYDSEISQRRFNLLTMEVMWELIIQGVITPGLNLENPNLPFFHITEYGGKVIKEERFVPHDSSGYLDSSRKIITDKIAMIYLEEALRCFTTGSYLASTILLGVASERLFLNFCEVLLDALIDSEERDAFVKICKNISMIAKIGWVRDKVEKIIKEDRKSLPENTLITLLGICDFIRQQRNDIGHPQDDLYAPTRDDAFVNLRLFPEYCGTLQKIEVYLKHNKV